MKNSRATFMILFSLFALGCQIPAYDLHREAEDFALQNQEIFKTISENGRNIHYLKYGNKTAQPVLFVHGSPGSWQGWIHFIKDQDLNSKFLLLALDRPGYGGSNKGETEPSLNLQAEALYSIIKTEKLKNVILVGHSLGGPIIARLAMNHPDAVAGLILVAASVTPELEKIKWYQYPASWVGIRNIIPTDLRVCNEEILPLKKELEDMRPLWKNIKARSIIIHGKNDDLVPVENVDFLTKNLDQDRILELAIIDNLNHFVPWLRPDLIKTAIYKISQSTLKTNQNQKSSSGE